MEDRKMDSTIKSALKRREGEGLPFNFSYRMMEQVRLEVCKKRKRQRMILYISLVVASLAIIGMLVYFLFFYLDISWNSYIPHVELVELPKLPKDIIGFYWYIGGLVIALLGLDYWVRSKRKVD